MGPIKLTDWQLQSSVRSQRPEGISRSTKLTFRFASIYVTTRLFNFVTVLLDSTHLFHSRRPISVQLTLATSSIWSEEQWHPLSIPLHSSFLSLVSMAILPPLLLICRRIFIFYRQNRYASYCDICIDVNILYFTSLLFFVVLVVVAME